MPHKEVQWLFPSIRNDDEPFRLATTDLMVPPVYSTYGVVFMLDLTCDKSRIIQWLGRGLEITLSQFGPLYGTIEKNEYGDFSVVKRKECGVRLEIQWLEEDGFVTYSDLATHHFSSHAFGDIAYLFIDGLQYGIFHPLDTSPVVSAFKLNFIRGGLIFSIHLHHCVIDNAGFGGFLHQLAENCRSMIHKAQPPILDIRCLDRSRFRCKEGSALQQNYRASHLELYASQPIHRSCTALLLHLPRCKAESLKRLATSPGGRIQISTYDAFCALLWRLVLRHRASIYTVDLHSPAFFYEIVNMRSRLGLPARFQGNALLAPTTDSLEDKLNILGVISDEPLWKLATCIRQVTNTATPEALQVLLDKASLVADKTKLRHFSTPLTKMSLGITDVRKPSILNADFGLGQLRAFRHFFHPFCPETLICVYPPRPLDEGEDAGYEFHVPIEKELVGQFLDDPDVLSYFDFHGFEAEPPDGYYKTSSRTWHL